MPPLLYDTAAWLRAYTLLPIPPLPGEPDAAGAPPDPVRAIPAVPLAGAVVGGIGGIVLVIAWLLGAHHFVAAALALLALIVVTDGRSERALAAVVERSSGRRDDHTAHHGLSGLADKLHLHHGHAAPLAGLSVYGVTAIVLAAMLRVGAIDALAVNAAIAAGFVLVGAGAVSRAAAVGFALVRPEPSSSGGETHDQTALQWLALFGLGIGIVAVFPGFGLGATVAGFAAAIGAVALVTAFVARAPGEDDRTFTGTAALAAEIAFLVAVVAFARAS